MHVSAIHRLYLMTQKISFPIIRTKKKVKKKEEGSLSVEGKTDIWSFSSEVSGTISIGLVSSQFIHSLLLQQHLLVTTFTAAERLLTSVHENIFARPKILLAIVTEAEETVRQIA